MNRRRTFLEYKHPATFDEIVAFADDEHERRIKELKAAEKLIRAVEPDLQALAAAKRIFAVGQHSMVLTEWTHGERSDRAKRGLFIDGGIFDESKDRLVAGFIDRGYQVDAIHADRSIPRLLLRRPKTQVRVILRCSLALAQQLLVQPAPEAK